jgi:hypothetical protein
MRSFTSLFLFLLSLTLSVPAPSALAAPDPATIVPATAPRTNILAGRADAFRAYVTTGEGAKAFALLKRDLDRDYLAPAAPKRPFTVPAEPITYGDPSPSKRDSAKADKWRAVQDLCGRVSAIAEAAALCWLVTGEDRYLAAARDILLATSAWHFAPDWKSGDVVGATDIYYNDEAHFRLWRKLPLVYDQIRSRLSPADRATILAHFKIRGERSAAWIEKEGNISKVSRNSIAADISSHPVRFMPMTGLTALALWDDLPAQARAWWNYSYTFYRDQFSPWGGDDGGWAEGNAYWRGTFEHAAFQDALLALGDPLAYASPFWKNSPLFAIYNVQPYLHTTFGDVSNAGRFNLEPVIADYMEHLARVQKNGVLLAYAALCTDTRTRPVDKGLDDLGRNYPTSAEFLVRNFIASALPLPAPVPLSTLPKNRYFTDVGWVSLHSALGQPTDDIHVTFKSSPYGSFSHSHADQNAFILNAYGEGLAINSAYREFHNSPHHAQWTRHTISKNALLLDGLGQKAQSKASTGKITRYEEKPRTVWTTGDATKAYSTLQPKDRVKRVTRDLVFIDSRYVVLRDRVVLTTPAKLSWLLHAEHTLAWHAPTSTATIVGPQKKSSLTTQLLAANLTWRATQTNQFPVPVDPKYASGAITGSYLSGKWTPQQHLTLESNESAAEFTLYSVLWPERGATPAKLAATLAADDTLTIPRPDGKTDRVQVTDTSLTLK